MRNLVNLLPLIAVVVMGQSCKSKQQAAQIDVEEAYSFQKVIKVSDYGAKVNDNIDDSEAIQNAINAALIPDNPSLVLFEAGIYDLRKGIVIARKLKDGNYGYVTMTLSGPIATYAVDQEIGSVTIFRGHHRGFMTAIQNGRNCVIQNIVYQGTANYTGKFMPSYSSDTAEWGDKANVKIHPNSPSCAIVIDPFHQNILQKDRYAGMTSYYTNTYRSGTSMCLIKGCSFSAHFIAIANNTSGWCMNGDNIKAENCHAEFCYIFWAAGQDQSRANSIENLYAIHINSLVHCAYIGSGRGTPPMLEKINLAGYSKEIATIKTGFSGFNARQCYFENIEQIGSIEANYASFDQCQFKFRTYGTPRFAPAYQMHCSKVANFNNCTLEYFANCTQQAPFVLRAEQLVLTGGFIEGGVVTADGVTNAGGDRLHNVTFNNVAVKCLNSIATNKINGAHEGALSNRVFIGGAVFTLYDGVKYFNTNPTYLCDFIENVQITIDTNLKTASFKTANPGLYRVGDNLFSTNIIQQPRVLLPNLSVKSHLGYVSKVTANTITLTGIPDISEGSQSLYLVSFPIFNKPVSLRVEKGSSIAIADNKEEVQNISIGTRVACGYFLRGSYITKIEGTRVSISTVSTGTAKTNVFDYVSK